MDFRFFRHKPDQNSPQPQSFFAQRRPHPVIARGRRVAFVEDEVDNLQYGRQACVEIGASWNFKRNLRLSQRTFRADNSLRNGWLGWIRDA